MSDTPDNTRTENETGTGIARRAFLAVATGGVTTTAGCSGLSDIDVSDVRTRASEILGQERLQGVTDAFGDPVPGTTVAVVAATDRGSELLTTLRTDGEGRYEVPSDVLATRTGEDDAVPITPKTRLKLIAIRQGNRPVEDSSVPPVTWFGTAETTPSALDDSGPPPIQLLDKRITPPRRLNRESIRERGEISAATVHLWEHISPDIPDERSARYDSDTVYRTLNLEVRSAFGFDPDSRSALPDDYLNLTTGTLSVQLPDEVRVVYPQTECTTDRKYVLYPTGRHHYRPETGLVERNRRARLLYELNDRTVEPERAGSIGDDDATDPLSIDVPADHVFESTAFDCVEPVTEEQAEPPSELVQFVAAAGDTALSVGGIVLLTATPPTAVTVGLFLLGTGFSAISSQNGGGSDGFESDCEVRPTPRNPNAFRESLADAEPLGNRAAPVVDPGEQDFVTVAWNRPLSVAVNRLPIAFPEPGVYTFGAHGMFHLVSGDGLERASTAGGIRDGFLIDSEQLSPLGSDDGRLTPNSDPAGMSAGSFPVQQQVDPVARVQTSDWGVTHGDEIRLNGGLSESPLSGVSIESYRWTVWPPRPPTLDAERGRRFRDAGETITFTPTEVGTYTVTLTVEDSNGGVARRTAEIGVMPEPSPLGDETQTGTWRTYRGNNARTGADPDGTGPSSSVSADWKFVPGEGESRLPISAPPVVVDGSIYIGTGESAKVVSVSLADGTREWHTDVPGGISQSLAVHNGTVYGVTNSAEQNAVYVFALSAADGSEKWQVALPDGGLTLGSPTPPAVTDESLYFGNIDTTLYALSTADGSEQWTYASPDEYTFTPPAVVDGTVVAGTALDAGLFNKTPVWIALSEEDGSERWNYTPDATGGASVPAIADDTAYVTGASGLHAISMEDGSPLWTRSLEGVEIDLPTAPAVTEESVYATGQSTVAMSPADGSEQWRVDRTLSVGLVAVDGTLYAGAGEVGDTVSALSMADGSQRWTVDVDGRLNGLAVGGGNVYTTSSPVFDDGGTLAAYSESE